MPEGRIVISQKAWHTRCARRDLANVPLGAPARASRRSVLAMGLVFPGALGLAAGFDPDGLLVGALEGSGLGAIEFGTVRSSTRSLQRLLRALERRRRWDSRRFAAQSEPIRYGVSVGKRVETPWSEASGELAGLLALLPGLADYVTLNPGPCPPRMNVFADVVSAVARQRERCAAGAPAPLPIMVKLPAAWMRGEEAWRGVAALLDAGADGLLVSAEGVPVRDHLETLHRLRDAHGPELGLVSVGGIASVRDVTLRLGAGANLVQIHGAARRVRRRPWIAQCITALSRCSRGAATASLHTYASDPSAFPDNGPVVTGPDRHRSHRAVAS